MISHAAGRRILSHGRGVRWQAAHEERHTRSPGPNRAASLAREARVLEHRVGSGLVTDKNTTNSPQEHVRLADPIVGEGSVVLRLK